MAPVIRVLVVEDEAILAGALRQTLQAEGVEVVGVAATGEEAVELFRAERPTHVLMDVRIRGEQDGVQVAGTMKRERPEVHILFLTGNGDGNTLARAGEVGPLAILLKPIGLDSLTAALVAQTEAATATKQAR